MDYTDEVIMGYARGVAQRLYPRYYQFDFDDIVGEAWIAAKRYCTPGRNISLNVITAAVGTRLQKRDRKNRRVGVTYAPDDFEVLRAGDFVGLIQDFKTNEAAECVKRAETRELLTETRKAINKLHPNRRKMARQHLISGKSNIKISNETGQSPQLVSSKLRAIRKRIAQSIRRDRQCLPTE